MSIDPRLDISPELPDHEYGTTESFGIAAVTLGIIGICMHWVAFFRWGILLFVAPLMLGIMALSLGYYDVRKTGVQNSGTKSLSLAGISLGMLTMMLTIAWLILAQTFLWGWNF